MDTVLFKTLPYLHYLTLPYLTSPRLTTKVQLQLQLQLPAARLDSTTGFVRRVVQTTSGSRSSHTFSCFKSLRPASPLLITRTRRSAFCLLTFPPVCIQR